MYLHLPVPDSGNAVQMPRYLMEYTVTLLRLVTHETDPRYRTQILHLLGVLMYIKLVE